MNLADYIVAFHGRTAGRSGYCSYHHCNEQDRLEYEKQMEMRKRRLNVRLFRNGLHDTQLFSIIFIDVPLRFHAYINSKFQLTSRSNIFMVIRDST